MGVEPVPDRPAAVADCGDERALVLADYHAGLEESLRRDGVELKSRAEERRALVVELLDETAPDRVVVLGDLATAIGQPAYAEREELDAFFEAVTARAPLTVVKGNHDGDIETVVADLGHDGSVDVSDGPGTRLGEVGFAHGHTWPSREVLGARTVCLAHEHPVVRLEDEVGGARTERAWLRGRLNPAPFREHYDDGVDATGDAVVFPAFNDLVGGTWVNDRDGFLAPFLPDGLVDAEAYLLDGTRLGPYREL